MKIFTDGSCRKNNGGAGGWAFVVVEKQEVIYHDNGFIESTTNNRMELTAIKRAIQWAIETGHDKVSINSDSQYCVNSLSIWYKQWERSRYKKGRVKNYGLISAIVELYDKIDVDYTWIKGHSGNYYNDLADELASQY